jgi:hypothetical protein
MRSGCNVNGITGVIGYGPERSSSHVLSQNIYGSLISVIAP